MYRKILIFCVLIFIIFMGTITYAFLYIDQSQKIIINIFNLKDYINGKVQFYILKQINDKTLSVNFNDITFLQPSWPNVIKIKIEDVNIKSTKQRSSSNIQTIELGMSYNNLFKNISLDQKEIIFDYIDIKDITLNGIIEINKFYPGPLMNILLMKKKII